MTIFWHGLWLHCNTRASFLFDSKYFNREWVSRRQKVVSQYHHSLFGFAWFGWKPMHWLLRNLPYPWIIVIKTINSWTRWCQILKHDILGIRLVGGSRAREGRVEIYHDTKWGRVCGYWTSATALVVCKQLGYASGSPIEDYGGGNGTIWIEHAWCR